MRLLHTSDWHLGQHFMGKTRLAEHQAFLGWLTEQIRQHDIDVVIVAGDIFDTGTPPSYARELYNNFVVSVQASGVTLVLLGGNHDSAAMLGESRELLACLNTIVVPSRAESSVLPLKTRQGETAALLCTLPYLRPRDVLGSQAGQGLAEKQQNLQQAIVDTYQTFFEQAQLLRHSTGPLPLIATGHLTTIGAQMSDSVREIYIGSLEAFPAAGFPPFDYIALGHIHRPQRVAGLEHIRYCGSPIPLSFDEAGQQKEVLMVEITSASGQTSPLSITALPVPCFQPMQTVRGSLTTLEDSIKQVATSGTADKPVWIDITVKVDGYISDLQTPLRKITDGLPVEILRIHRERQTAPTALRRQAQETLVELTPQDVFKHRLAHENLDSALQTALETLYQHVIEDVREQTR